MSAAQPQPIVLGPEEGERAQLMALGVRFMLGSEATGGGFSLVEHPMGPRTLGSPMHVHQHEDEYSFVLEGSVGVHVGDDVRVAGPGDLVFKPRQVWHAFWNAGDTPARILEIISPGGFEGYFAELAPLMPPQVAEVDGEAVAAVAARYGLTLDFGSIERLSAEHGLTG
jgi:quercetin dioxygenase-like cupin family protein